jgi:glutathione S-transferase
MRLYSYYRSSAAYRVRIALNLKQIEHSIEPVNLLKKEHKSPHYLAKQPQGLVPCLERIKGNF